jgi:hypothetical protein
MLTSEIEPLLTYFFSLLSFLSYPTPAYFDDVRGSRLGLYGLGFPEVAT